MYDYEKLGVFYLGREYDLQQRALGQAEVLYDSKDLTTHAVIVGMTGSGKTGLGIALLEEAAIDNIPALIIDPKGDMGNLLLNFPELRAEDFEPWIEREEALRKGMSVPEFAARQAERTGRLESASGSSTAPA
jgi:DNA helicase HerA-like ATPase